MKICMIVPNPLVKGGIASVVNGYRGSALEKAHEIRYVVSYRDGSKMQKLGQALQGYGTFWKTLRHDKPDIVHIHSSFGPSFYRKIPFIYLACLFKIPVVNHVHGADFDSFYEKASKQKRWLVRKVYSRCSRFIVLSAEWKDAISQIVKAGKIDIIENYCILPKAPYDAGRKPEQVLFLGALEERKGCYEIPAIFEKVKKSCPQARLVMAGDGEMEQVKAAFAAKSLLSETEFTGWIRGKEKQELMQRSAVFLFPTHNEGMPVAVLEAMSYGMGIVTTRVGGIPQLIREGESGYLEKDGDWEKIAEDVILLLQDEERCRKMGLRAREEAEQKYSLEAHLRKLERVYRKACRKK